MGAREWRQTQDVLLEVVDAQKRQLSQMARMLEILRQEHERMRERVSQADASLLAGAREVGEGGQRLAQDVMRTLGSLGRQSIGDALGLLLEDAKKGIDQAAKRMAQSGETAARQMESLARSQRAFARVSLVRGYSCYWGPRSGHGIWGARRASTASRLYRAPGIGRADRVKCGAGLCANVDISVRGQGERQQYWPVRARSGATETP